MKEVYYLFPIPESFQFIKQILLFWRDLIRLGFLPYMALITKRSYN